MTDDIRTGADTRSPRPDRRAGRGMGLPARIAVAVLTGLVGMGFMAAMIWPDTTHRDRGAIVLLTLSAGASAGIAGGLCAGAFGRPGLPGLVAAFFGALGATLLGAVVGGILMMTLLGLMAGPGPSFDAFIAVVSLGAIRGPVLVATTLVRVPAVSGLWIGGFLLVHLAARRLRR